MADNLATQVAFDRAVLASDPPSFLGVGRRQPLAPVGQSIFHPISRAASTRPRPTSNASWRPFPGDRYADDLATERRLGRRWLGALGGIEWLAAFAPPAPGDIRAFLPGGPSSPAELVTPRQLLVDALQEVHC